MACPRTGRRRIRSARRNVAIAVPFCRRVAVFKLALGQMLVEGGAKEANVARAEMFIARAAASGARVVLLPEALNLGWTHGAARTEADAIPDGETCTRLRAAARRNA